MRYPADIRWLRPASLEELPAVFDEVAHGQSVALCPPDTELEQMDLPPTDDTAIWLGVTSSGSTGQPKLVWRQWDDLKAALSQRPEIRGWLWAAPYAPWTFAGVHVALQAWLVQGRVLSLPHEWTEAWRRLVQERPEAVSATPTYLDLLVQEESGDDADGASVAKAGTVPPVSQPAREPTGMSAASAVSRQVAEGGRWNPRQITLGGEPLRPGVARRLTARFPFAHFTVIYAAAEFGVIATTHRTDGWYEVASLDTRFPNRWRINSASVLELKRGEGHEWATTGDKAVLQDGLFSIVGRADGVANVAGTKVNLAEVAEFAEEVPGVLRAVALAEDNSVTGQVVCLRYAPDPRVDRDQVARALEVHLRNRLRKEAWPRRWVVDPVAPAQNAKRALA